MRNDSITFRLFFQVKNLIVIKFTTLKSVNFSKTISMIESRLPNFPSQMPANVLYSYMFQLEFTEGLLLFSPSLG